MLNLVTDTQQSKLQAGTVTSVSR